MKREKIPVRLTHPNFGTVIHMKVENTEAFHNVMLALQNNSFFQFWTLFVNEEKYQAGKKPEEYGNTMITQSHLAKITETLGAYVQKKNGGYDIVTQVSTDPLEEDEVHYACYGSAWYRQKDLKIIRPATAQDWARIINRYRVGND